MPASALIVGCGDVGCRLALLLNAAGIVASGLARSERSAQALAALGIAAFRADLDADDIDACVAASFNWIFYFAPPSDVGADDPRLRRFLIALKRPPRRLVYLSTSAVYGDCGGRWIDETAPLAPKSERGRRRLDAECAALDYAAASGCETLILRVPGIYGPGRLPVERLRTGRPVLRIAESPYTNRIHADDLAAAALHVAAHGRAGEAYNVSDGQPTTMTDYFLRCARLLGLPEPPQISLAEARQSFSPMLLSFLEESKRLSNRRLVATLDWTPEFPDLAAGLPACLGDDVVSRAAHADIQSAKAFR